MKTSDPVISFRLPAGLRDALDAEAKRLSAQLPGVEISRSDAVRILLTRVLTLATPEGQDAGREVVDRIDRRTPKRKAPR